MTEIRYRVGNHQPQNLYRDDTYIGVMFSPVDAAIVVAHLNAGLRDAAGSEACSGCRCLGTCSCPEVGP